MAGTIERQKIVERDTFTYDEKEAIAAKSDHRCAHCGKKVYFGYGASIEHFVPLSKGGTNRNINLVLLCENCNEAKGNLILKPREYLNYLDSAEKEKLEGYFDSYTKSFEYVSRANLLSCDQYRIYIDSAYACKSPSFYRHKKGRNAANAIQSHATLKRAEVDDIPRLADYFEKYVKKYNCYKDRETVDLNIRFWYQFGCIYYIESCGEIKCMTAITVTKIEEDIDEDRNNDDSPEYMLSMSLFPYYDTMQSITLCNGIMKNIPMLLLNEQELLQIPVRINMVKGDAVAGLLRKVNGTTAYSTEDDAMDHQYIVMHAIDGDMLPKLSKDKKLQEFFGKFANIEEDVKRWVGGNKAMEWMFSEIKLSPTGA